MDINPLAFLQASRHNGSGPEMTGGAFCTSFFESSEETGGLSCTSVLESSEETGAACCTSVFESSEETGGAFCTSVFDCSGVTEGVSCTSVFEFCDETGGDFCTSVFESSEVLGSICEPSSGMVGCVMGQDMCLYVCLCWRWCSRFEIKILLTLFSSMSRQYYLTRPKVLLSFDSHRE